MVASQRRAPPLIPLQQALRLLLCLLQPLHQRLAWAPRMLCFPQLQVLLWHTPPLCWAQVPPQEQAQVQARGRAQAQGPQPLAVLPHQPLQTLQSRRVAGWRPPVDGQRLAGP